MYYSHVTDYSTLYNEMLDKCHVHDISCNDIAQVDQATHMQTDMDSSLTSFDNHEALI